MVFCHPKVIFTKYFVQLFLFKVIIQGQLWGVCRLEALHPDSHRQWKGIPTRLAKPESLNRSIWIKRVHLPLEADGKVSKYLSLKAGVTVPPKHRGKCRQQECKKTKRVKRVGSIILNCNFKLKKKILIVEYTERAGPILLRHGESGKWLFLPNQEGWQM